MTQLDRYRYEPENSEQGAKLAAWIHQSKLAPRGLSPHDIFLVMAAGAEYGWSTMRSLRSLYVIDGRVCMYADAIVGLVKASEACTYFRIVESGDEHATYETLRSGSPEPERMRYARADAERARLWGRKGPWTQYPADMLRARAAVRLARAVYPDVVGGIYDPDEMSDVVEVRAEPNPEPVAVVIEHEHEREIDVAPATKPTIELNPEHGPPDPEDFKRFSAAYQRHYAKLSGMKPMDAYRAAVRGLVSSGVYSTKAAKADMKSAVMFAKDVQNDERMGLRHIAHALAALELAPLGSAT